MDKAKQKVYSLLLFLCLFLIYLLSIFVRNWFFVVDRVSTHDGIVFFVFPCINFILLFCMPLVAVRLFPQFADFDRSLIRKPRPGIRWYFLLFLLPLVTGALIRFISDKTGLSAVNPIIYKDVTELTLVFFIIRAIHVAFLVPLSEELFWRGYAQDQFHKCFGGGGALFLQAFLFALVHARPLLGFLNVFCMGLIWGFWRYKRRSLLPIMLVHAVFNGFYVLGHYPKRYEASKINIAVDYIDEFNKLGNTGPAEDNADADYRKALSFYTRPPREVFDVLRKNLWPEALSSDQQIAMKQWLEQNQEAMSLFRQAAKKSFYWPQYSGESMIDLFEQSESHWLSEMAWALCWNARLSAKDGDVKQAIDDLICCWRFGHHLTSGPKDSIDQLTGLSIRRMTCETGIAVLCHVQMNPDQLTYFQDQIRITRKDQDRTLNLTCVKFTLYDIIQRIFTDDGQGGGHIPKHEREGQDLKMLKILSPDLSEEQILQSFQSDRKRTIELVDELWAFFNEAFSKSPVQLHREGIDIDQVIKEKAGGNVIFPYLIGHGTRHQVYYRVMADEDALDTTLAILRYKALYNTLPASLDWLVTVGHLDHLPIDPYSGESFVYKRDINTFTLYSIGKDFEDDGGNKDNDSVYWPVSSTE